LTAILPLCACATSRVTPVREAPVAAAQAPAAPPPLKRICVVENPRVKPEFLDAYRGALSARGYEAVVYKKTPPASQCPLTSRYVAYWSFRDLVYYMSHAELTVYRDGQPAGRALFNARSSRFIDMESTVANLVQQLLPN
jgi:hypothetical protein